MSDRPESDDSTLDGPEETVDWAQLPRPVRVRLVRLAAEAVARLPTVDVPATLRAVARFAPAKRARSGAAPLLAALEEVGFRSAVAQWWRDNDPAELDVAVADPVAAAAAAVLLNSPQAAQRVREAGEWAQAQRRRADRDAALTEAARAEGELERLRVELERALARARHAEDDRAAESAKLRSRLREAGGLQRHAEDAARSAAADLALARRGLAELAAERDAAIAMSTAERARADRALADLAAARQSAREARQADEVRLQLLLDTLTGALNGLRRELALADGGLGPRPADLVGGVRSPAGGVSTVVDPAALDRLLGLPAVHLIVDGYNVTKTGYPEQSLAVQRERLSSQLAVLAARTGAEATVVFDGAGVIGVPSASGRGVRVLFSAEGVSADDVIRALVAAEPQGRTVVVVTSDRAVADSVRVRAAHPVPSAVLLARLRRT